MFNAFLMGKAFTLTGKILIGFWCNKKANSITFVFLLYETKY